MAGKHWSDGDLLEALYGVGPQDEHLSGCQECRARLNAMQARREHLRAADIRVSQQFLDRQRWAILERLKPKTRRFHLQPAPVLAAMLLLFVILSIFRPAAEIQPFVSESDALVFEDIFDIASSLEPSAVSPVHSLFEVEQ